MLTRGLPREKIKKETPKVYCSNCIHFSENSRYGGALKDGAVYDDECKVRLEHRDTWKERESYYPYPQVKNLHNDCGDYDEVSIRQVVTCKYCGANTIHIHNMNNGILMICNNEFCIGFLHDVTDEWMYNMVIDKFVPVPEDLKIRKI